MVLEGLPVDIEDKLSLLTQFQVEIDGGFDAADLVREDSWEYRSSLAKGNACLGVVGLVEGDVDGLVLGKVLSNQHMLLSFNEELKCLRSVQTSN